MRALLAVAEHALVDRLIGAGMATAKRSQPIGFMAALSSVLLVLGLFLAIFGTHLWLLKIYTPEVAVLLTGALCLALSALSALAILVILQYGRSQIKQVKQDIEETISEVIDSAQAEISGPVRDNPKTAVLISALAGLYAGEKVL